MDDYSIVEIFDEPVEGHRCGYCKSDKGSLSYGMWAHTLTVRDYQSLIDRGWRRSGKYCYKPLMQRTCCPLYTIKCAANEIQLSKSHKKVLRRMQRFLNLGDSKEENVVEQSGIAKDGGGPFDSIDALHLQSRASVAEKNMEDKKVDKSINHLTSSKKLKNTSHNTGKKMTSSNPSTSKTLPKATEDTALKAIEKDEELTEKLVISRQPKQGRGPDPNKPPCKKAKLLRMERKLEKLNNKFDSSTDSISKTEKSNITKTLRDYLSEPLPANSVHKLEIRLVPSEPPNAEFHRTFEESYAIYKKYQMTIHGDSPDRCSSAQFSRFLVHSPLEPVKPDNPHHPGYGSFHQQYWLDNNLIAVGVIDILPYCISSVYFYYDPKYHFLSLGTYAALREIAFTQELSKTFNELQFYYMGFYIHSCQKMRYKGQYTPSLLLCPEAYTWHPIEKARLKLDNTKYSRLEETDLDDEDGKVDIGDVLVLYKRSALPYIIYSSFKRGCDGEVDDILKYTKMVGKKCVGNMLLYRK